MNNNLIVIENGRLMSYLLDDKLVWEVGRPSNTSHPDIKLYSATVSRQHGRFENTDGMWFYLDNYGKNGTVYNGKHVSAGPKGRIKPISLKEGDILIFGGGEEAIINHKTIWAMFSTRYYDGRWKVIDTNGCTTISMVDGDRVTKYINPVKGTVINGDNGRAIYMGDITYMVGDVSLTGN